MGDALSLPASDHQQTALRLPIGLALLVPVLLVGNLFGELARYQGLGAAVLYPPYAALTAVLVWSPRRDWIWYLAASALAHTVTHVPEWRFTWVLVADIANVTRALLAALLLRWRFGGPPRFDSIRALLEFVAIAVIAAPAAAASIGAANVVWHGASSSYWSPWKQWFISNALTGLTILPLFIYAIAAGFRRHRSLEWKRVGEACLLVAGLAVTCGVAFLWDVGNGAEALPLYYAPVPPLIWAALRFGSGGASLAVTVVTLAAIVGAERGTALSGASTENVVLMLQLLVLLTSLPVLCIAAVSSARQSAVGEYRALLASLHEQVAILDAHGHIAETNASWRRFAASHAGLPFDRATIGQDFLAACRDAAALSGGTAAELVAGLETVLTGQGPLVELEYSDGDGNSGEGAGAEWYVLRVERFEHANGGAVVTRTNVTARRRAQMEIEEQRHALSHLARVSVLGELTGSLAHELRQPLATILANGQAAQRMLKTDQLDLAEFRAIIDDIVVEDQRAGQVVNRLRALLGRGDTRRQAIDLGELVRDVIELAHAELITRRVVVTTAIEPGLPSVQGDRVQLQQVLLNLILNACESMSAVSDADRPLMIRAEPTPAGDVHLSVADGGTGIPDGLIKRVFEPFVTTKAEGLGLGLSISRTIVAAHGGRIWVENNRDRGATLHCTLAATGHDVLPTARQDSLRTHDMDAGDPEVGNWQRV